AITLIKCRSCAISSSAPFVELWRLKKVGIIQFAKSAWGETVPIHIGWNLIWVFAIAGLAFLIGHAIWVRFTKEEEFAGHTSASQAARVPDKVKRHSLTARLFHWIQAAAMLTLL